MPPSASSKIWIFSWIAQPLPSKGQDYPLFTVRSAKDLGALGILTTHQQAPLGTPEPDRSFRHKRKFNFLYQNAKAEKNDVKLLSRGRPNRALINVAHSGTGELDDRELGAGVAQAYRQKFQTIPDKNLAISD
ncbi:MAG: hypothetical protein ORN83_02555 [Chthoniobacteraceae bacterium]|nr:hypothetical protein [Chthoniobacteraceae bacterium]